MANFAKSTQNLNFRCLRRTNPNLFVKPVEKKASLLLNWMTFAPAIDLKKGVWRSRPICLWNDQIRLDLSIYCSITTGVVHEYADYHLQVRAHFVQYFTYYICEWHVDILPTHNSKWTFIRSNILPTLKDWGREVISSPESCLACFPNDPKVRCLGLFPLWYGWKNTHL